ncbi:hypothetical protein [Streptomyces caniferus]|uniref:hypothetical protein n=1 Tax=Streptomyces caniferus TaxID=285557 RepID=UPI0037FAF49E
MAPVAPQEAGEAEAVPAAVRGRLRGTVPGLAPVFGFTLTFALTHRLAVALTLAFAAGAGVFVGRLVRKESVRRAPGVLGFVRVHAPAPAEAGADPSPPLERTVR